MLERSVSQEREQASAAMERERADHLKQMKDMEVALDDSIIIISVGNNDVPG